MSLPRKNRQSAVIYPTVTATDHRGNDVKSPNMAAPIPVRATFSPLGKDGTYHRSTDILTYHMLIDTLPEGVDIYSRVEWRGDQWDITSRPAPLAGSRHVQHWTLEIQKR